MHLLHINGQNIYHPLHLKTPELNTESSSSYEDPGSSAEEINWRPKGTPPPPRVLPHKKNIGPVDGEVCDNKMRPKSKSWSLFWAILVVVEGLVLYMFHRHVVQDTTTIIESLKEDIFYSENIIKNLADEKNVLLRNIQEARRRYDNLEKLYEKLRAKTDEASRKGSKSEEESARRKESCGASESEEDKMKANEASVWDDDEDSIYCWLDGFFNSNFFTNPDECKRPKKMICPFKDAEDAIRHLKIHPKFLELQITRRKSKERKKLLNALSLEFHPDKILAFGCPPSYGEAAQAMINGYR